MLPGAYEHISVCVLVALQKKKSINIEHVHVQIVQTYDIHVYSGGPGFLE